jgi:uncharacterized protein
MDVRLAVRMTSPQERHMTDDLLSHRPGKDADPYEVWEFAGIVLRGDPYRWADMFTVDGVMEMPLAPPGFPRRIEGRDRIRRLMAPVQERAFALHDSRRTSLTLHRTTDRDVIICEFESVKIDKATGRTYPMPYVHVLKVHAGEIVWLRDYAPFQLAPPSVDDVLAQLGTGPPGNA